MGFRPNNARLAAALLGAVVALAPVTGALADPPPWAPAHGHRDKGKDKHKHRDRDDGPVVWHDGGRGAYPAFFALPVGIEQGRCDRGLVGANLGTLLGAVAGGLGGSQIGRGDGQIAATIAGVLLGAAVGNAVQQNMEPADQGCLAQTLERAPTGRNVVWNNPDTGARYEVVPTRTWEQGGTYCREYSSRGIVGGRTQEITGTACRQPDGSWKIVG